MRGASATVRLLARRCRSPASRAARSSRSRRSRTSDPFIVRRATPEDAAGIARVRGRTWRAAYSHIFSREQLNSISEEGDAERWGRHLRSLPPRAATYVAERAGDIVGFTSIGPSSSRDDPALGELYSIYVLPDQWGAGVGRALMSEALGVLRSHRFAEAVLWVLEDNPRTRRFYELAGWHADGQVKEDEWLDSLVREVRYRIDLRGGAE